MPTHTLPKLLRQLHHQHRSSRPRISPPRGIGRFPPVSGYFSTRPRAAATFPPVFTVCRKIWPSPTPRRSRRGHLVFTRNPDGVSPSGDTTKRLHILQLLDRTIIAGPAAATGLEVGVVAGAVLEQRHSKAETSASREPSPKPEKHHTSSWISRWAGILASVQRRGMNRSSRRSPAFVMRA